MKQYFTEAQKEEGLHIVEIEEDDLSLEGEWVEGEGRNYVIGGIATIEGERYHDFQIEFALLEDPAGDELEDILAVPWDWYDYLCD